MRDAEAEADDAAPPVDVQELETGKRYDGMACKMMASRYSAG